MIKILLISIAVVVFTQSVGQQRSVSGKILTGEGNPLAGANVSVDKSPVHTSTDSTGLFILQAPDGDILLNISHSGYGSQAVTVSRSQNFITVFLKIDETILKDVTVNTGYQQLSKERATGSFSSVGNSLFNRAVSTDVLSRLENVTSGLLFDRRSTGEPVLTVRGQSTILSNASPLIVVDNFPYEGNLNNLNPNDIEQVTVLKDAAAASIWGARAGNGVIVITTKTGSINQPLKVNFNTNYTVGEQPNLFYNRNYLNSNDFIGVEQKLFSSGYYTWQEREKGRTLSPVVQLLIAERDGEISQSEAAQRLEEYKNTDVRKQISKYFYRRSFTQQYSLSLNGGGKEIKYYFSGGFDRNLENLVRNILCRATVQSSATYVPYKSLEINTGISYAKSILEENNSGIGQINSGGGKQLYPYANIADLDGNPLPIERDYNRKYVLNAMENGLLDWQYRPLEDLKNNNNTLTTNNLRLQVGVKYKIASWVNVEGNYQHVDQNIIRQNLMNEKLYYVRNLINQYTYEQASGLQFAIPKGSIFDKSTTNTYSHAGRAQINVDKNWDTRHKLSLLAGYEIRLVNTTALNSRLYGYRDELGIYESVDLRNYYPTNPYGYSAKIPSFGSLRELTDRNISQYMNGVYIYKQRYIVSGSARKDASNLFGVKSNQKWVPLWSAGMAWIASSETSFPFSSWLPYLKFRASWGYNGNVNKSLTAYTTASYSTNYYTGLLQLQIQTPPNPELRWEKIKIANIGADFQTRNNLFSGSFEFYIKNGIDLIGSSPLDPTTGFNVGGRTNFTGNNANMKGHGFDIQLNSHASFRKLIWNSSLLFNNATDKVTRYDFEDNLLSYLSNYSSPAVGRPRYGIYSFEAAPLDPENGDPQVYIGGKITKDYSSINYSATFNDLVYNGPALPTTFGSWRNNFSVGSISFGINLSYKFGYYFRRQSINYAGLFDSWAGNVDFEHRWQKPGDELITYVPSMPESPNSSRDFIYSLSSVLVEKGDHIRFQDINLSYRFERIANPRMPFSAIAIYGYINNLGILWRANKLNIDPDFVFQPYPPGKTYSLGISVRF